MSVLYALTYGCLSEFYLGMIGGAGLGRCGMVDFAIYIAGSLRSRDIGMKKQFKDSGYKQSQRKMIHIKRALIESTLLLFPNDHMMLQECTI